MVGTESFALTYWIERRALRAQRTTTMAGGRVYELPGPTSPTFPYVGYAIIPLEDANVTGQDVVMARFNVTVVVVSDGYKTPELAEFAGELSTVFPLKVATLDDVTPYGTVIGFRRILPVNLPKDDARGARFTHVGESYEASVQ